jgi:hypothetical protein
MLLHLNKSNNSLEVSQLGISDALEGIFREIRCRYPLTEPSMYQTTKEHHIHKTSIYDMPDPSTGPSETDIPIELFTLSQIFTGIPTRKTTKTRVNYFNAVRFIILLDLRFIKMYISIYYKFHDSNNNYIGIVNPSEILLFIHTC